MARSVNIGTKVFPIPIHWFQIHIQSSSPYKEPFFDSGFMNNKADYAPIRWSYKKTREVARRMDGSYASLDQAPFLPLMGYRYQPSEESSLPIIRASTPLPPQRRRTSTSTRRGTFCLMASLSVFTWVCDTLIVLRGFLLTLLMLGTWHK